MKALRCHHFGPPSQLVFEDIPVPVPAAGEVRIEVRAAGINYPDLLIIEDKYQIKAPLPFSPGGEFSGVVAANGPGASRFQPGDAVIGFTGWGGFAQQAVVAEDRLFAMPHGLAFDIAGTLLMTYGTAWHALIDRAALVPGETVLVLGAAGGIGTACIELAKARGARVIAAASTPDKLDVCRQLGADATIAYETEDLRERIKDLTDGRGVDVVCDPVGGRFSEQALRSTAWRGRFLVIGFASGEISRIPLNLPLLKGCAIVGVFWGDFLRRERPAVEADLRELAELVQSGRIRPLLSRHCTLQETAAALEDFAQRKVTGKWVVLP
jgi:NADPH:quinone reductase